MLVVPAEPGTPSEPPAPPVDPMPGQPPETPGETPPEPTRDDPPPPPAPVPTQNDPAPQVPTVMDPDRRILQPAVDPAPEGRQITATDQEGGELPCWLTIDPRTGAINGRPSDKVAAENVPVIVIQQLPQADGTTKRVTIVVEPRLFGAGGSECNIVRTTPTARRGQQDRPR